MKVLLLTGRILFSLIFIFSGFGHFNSESVAYAASKGVIMPELLVPASGVLAIAGGLSVLLGFWAKAGAWLLILFLIPVSLTMHNFWAITDPEARQMQLIMFMKNVSMLGGALFIAYFGAGPLSLDAVRNKSSAKAGVQ